VCGPFGPSLWLVAGVSGTWHRRQARARAVTEPLCALTARAPGDGVPLDQWALDESHTQRSAFRWGLGLRGGPDLAVSAELGWPARSVFWSAGEWDSRGEGERGEISECVIDEPRTQGDPSDPAGRPVTRTHPLVPGASVVGGRYRLLHAHGGSGLQRFWHAQDTVNVRDVALTVIDPAPHGPVLSVPGRTGSAPDRRKVSDPQGVPRRTLWLLRIDTPAVATVLDVVPQDSGGLVVAQWTPGRSLTEVAATAPDPVAAAQAVSALAAGADAAHRGDAALGLDHPDRIRITPAGEAVLAFPGVPAAATPQSDIQGLGAILYALLTGYWPLPPPPRTASTTEGCIGGLPLAVRGPTGAVRAAHLLRPEVPSEISKIIDRALHPTGGVCTAAAVRTALQRVGTATEDTNTVPTRGDGHASAATTGRDPSRARRTRAGRFTVAPRSTKLALTLLAVIVVGLVLLGYVMTQAVSLLGGSGAVQLPSLSSPNATSSTPSPTAPATPSPPPPATGPVTASTVTVFSPQGIPDNSATAARVIDGDPATTWSTDRYRNQFPTFKQGVGLLLTLAHTPTLSSIDIDSPSAGTIVEIRSATTATPTLSETTLLTTATLDLAHTTITLPTNQPVPYLLVWITHLAGRPGAYTSTIGELTLHPGG